MDPIKTVILKKSQFERFRKKGYINGQCFWREENNRVIVKTYFKSVAKYL